MMSPTYRPAALIFRPGTLRRVASRSRRAFSMVEILVVMSIIVVLATLTVVGIRSVGGNAKEKQTRNMLERLRNGLGEVTLNSASKQRLYQVIIPEVYGKEENGTAEVWNAVPAASVNSVYKTGTIIRLLSSNAAFKKLIDDLPTSEKVQLEFDRTTGLLATGTTSQANREKLVLPLDAWGKPIVFVYDNWEVPQADGLGIRRLADGKATGGLTDLYSDSAKTFWEWTPANLRPDTDDTTYVYETAMNDSSFNRRSGATPYTRAGEAFRNTADRTPFFFSAGRDEQYQTHDDNLYSFEGN